METPNIPTWEQLREHARNDSMSNICLQAVTQLASYRNLSAQKLYDSLVSEYGGAVGAAGAGGTTGGQTGGSRRSNT